MANAAKRGKPSRSSQETVPLYEQVANVLRARILSHDDREGLALEREYDLCRLHGVSRITISKSLDILEAEGLIVRARRRGTHSIPAAVRRLKRQRQTRVIQVTTPWPDVAGDPSTYYGQMYQGLLEAAQTTDYLLNMQRLRVDQVSLPSDHFNLPEPSTTLGTILMGLMYEPLIRMFAQQPYPVVCLDYWPHNTEADAVVVDCFNEGEQAVEYLLRQGHSRLFYLGNRQSNGDKEADAELMLAGIQRTMELAGRPPIAPERVLFCETPKNGQVAPVVDWLANLQPRPTAGIVFSIGTLESLLEPLRQRGISCPADISLISKFPERQATSATGMLSFPRTMGELAVECILQRSSGRRSHPVRLALPSRLQLGSTVTYLQ